MIRAYGVFVMGLITCFGATAVTSKEQHNALFAIELIAGSF
jgi:hypothetical protein